MNLLLANGHPDAQQYPLGMLADEAALVVDRENNRIASEALAIKAAASAVWSEAGAKHFDEIIERLTGG